MRVTKRILPLLVAAALLAACDGDTVESQYSKLRASFSYSPVNTIAPLTQALGSYGEFCTITADASHYYFATLTNSAQVNRDAVAAYRTFICIGGFIVGRSSQTDIGTANYPLLCYDLACPNCYREDFYKNLRLQNGGTAVCQRCGRTYDLNNGGVIVSGNKGRKLERYRISYDGTSIMVAN